MDPNSSLRTFRDFILQYNKISESCFTHCVDHLSERDLSQDECRCVDMCTKKHISVNHKVMHVFMELQPVIVNKRIEDMNKQQNALEPSRTEEIKSSEKPAILGEEKSITNKTQESISDVPDDEKKLAIRTK